MHLPNIGFNSSLSRLEKSNREGFGTLRPAMTDSRADVLPTELPLYPKLSGRYKRTS